MQRTLLVATFAVLVLAFLATGGQRYLSLDSLKEQLSLIAQFYAAHPWQTALGYFLVYVLMTGLSLPGAAVLTLVGGAIFGLLWGTVLVSFASSLGATAAFLAARFVLRDWVQGRFGHALGRLNEGIEREGSFYLFALRLIPAVPFFAINLTAGLTRMRTGTFYWISQLGMLAGTVAYVNAGTQLGAIASPQGILSPRLLGAFVLLGAFPLLAKTGVARLRTRRALAHWTRPKKFERNLVVIGAGSAGLVAAYIAAALRAKVTLVERHAMGGDCLNTGCVPSKALIRSARALAQMRRASEYGIQCANVEIDFAEIMRRVHRVIQTVAPRDSVERYSALGVECLRGQARLASPWEVDVWLEDGTTRRLRTRSIVIAAGARPFVPPIPGIAQVGCLTSDTVWSLREPPRRLVVLGGGPIGSELAQCFARFGAKVTQIEMLPRILSREDPDVSELVTRQFMKDGIEVLAGHKVIEFRLENGEKSLLAECAGKTVRIAFDALLCAVGRAANTRGYGLEELGIALNKQGTIQTNEYLQTVIPNVYACGDVAGPYQFTHTAAHQAWYAAVNALFGGLKRLRVDYSVIPWAIFTDPEVARVGLNETEAGERDVAYEVSTYTMNELDRAIADEAAHGMIKVLTVPGKDRILGATIVGEHAGESIAEFVTAMRHGLGLKKILSTIHVYPTFAEANKHVAGVWRRTHASDRLLRGLERFNAWMRH